MRNPLTLNKWKNGYESYRQRFRNEIYWADAVRIHVTRIAEPRHMYQFETSPDRKHLKRLILTAPMDVPKGDPLSHAEQFEQAAKEAGREFLGEVLVKCPKCGFEGGKSFGSMGSFDFGFENEFYPICPVVTEKLNQGGLAGPLWLHCPYFRDAAAKVRPKAA